MDNQRKASITDRQAALAEGERIVKAYPIVKVVITEASTGEETTLSGNSAGVGFI